MLAMAMTEPRSGNVVALDLERPVPGQNQVLVRVLSCGVCRTDLHVVDGDLPSFKLPIVPGHEIVGRVEQVGSAVESFLLGERVGIRWLGYSCGVCEYCRSGRENLCRNARFTGYQIDGGYAEYAVADARFCFRIPESYDDWHAAPLLCAGLIGYRAYRMAGGGKRLGIYGFGAAAHIIAQVAVIQGREVYAFVKPGDEEAQRFALGLGAVWAGASTDRPPVDLDASLIFAPVGSLVPAALSHTVPGGIVVCAGIHMSDIPSFPYHLLWEERTVRSVANLTREDAREFLELAGHAPLRTHIRAYPLTQANDALNHLRHGRLSGAAVLIP
jgi:propanol-preferring alcohol dehydrogenase